MARSTFRWPTEYQDQPLAALLAALRDKSWLPAASAPLVEQIREGIFILTRMARKLDHYSLIFFH
jgi:hypothetical protein